MRTEGVPQNDDSEYRDYLVAVICDFVTKPKHPGGVEFGPPPPSPAEMLNLTRQDLKKRFKQDFGVLDNTIIGANLVAIEVVKAALVEDLNFSASSVPAQGTLADRSYLDQLIATSRAKPDSLSTTYRIDLSRSDLEATTRVRENIVTLQSHMRDGKFDAGYNPFFLYKDEWRLRFQTPFFPENHYALRRGLFANEEDRSLARGLMDAVRNHPDFNSSTSRASGFGFLSRMDTLMHLDSRLTEGHSRFAAEEYGLARDAYANAQADIQALKGELQYQAWACNGDHIEPIPVTISLGDPQAFRDSFDPRNNLRAAQVASEWPGMGLFGARPPWEGPYSDTWMNQTWPQGRDQGWWDPFDVPTKVPPQCPFTSFLFDRLGWRYDNRPALNVRSIAELKDLESRNVADPSKWPYQRDAKYADLESALLKLHDDLVSLVPHVYFFLLPVCLGDVALEMGEYAAAARTYAEAFSEHLLRASLLTETPGEYPQQPEAGGDLPWTSTAAAPRNLEFVGSTYAYLNNACDVPYLKLRCGDLYLRWADMLYRTDQQPEVYRARELYRALLRQYGIDPVPGGGLAPVEGFEWKSSSHYDLGPWHALEIRATREAERVGAGLSLSSPAPGFGPAHEVATVAVGAAHSAASGQAVSVAESKSGGSSVRAAVAANLPEAARTAFAPVRLAGLDVATLASPDADFAGSFITGAHVAFVVRTNPAIVAQQMRAKIGISQIDSGLNYFGCGDDLVPVLRYRPLSTAANYFAGLAKQAQADFLSYKDQAEKEELALIVAQRAARAAAVRVQIESERIVQAGDYLIQAQVQVQQVQDAIKAKQAEIDDHNSLCGQMKDFFGGVFSFISGAPGFLMDPIKSGVSGTLKGGEAASVGAAGLGVVGGMALVGIAGAYTMNGMADAANTRVSDIQKLKTQQLPMALAGLDARRRDLSIAEMQKTVAALEAEAAQEILRFMELRTLSLDVWITMASYVKKVMRRYLDLGAMTGWLAERALSYAQNRDIRLVRFDYYQSSTSSVLPADALKMDLADLESEYVAGARKMLPITWTVSLAHDFPLQFAQLKTHGRCTFMTDAAVLDRAYPGTFGHRIRSVEVMAVVPGTSTPPRGLLANPGISRIENEKLDGWHTLVRPPDVMPLSVFNPHSEPGVYGYSGDTLLSFEGSGVDTLWSIEFPAAANPQGLAALANICLTFDLEALFSSSRATALGARPPEALRYAALFSAKQLFPKALKDFVGAAGDAQLVFDIHPSLLPAAEKNRFVTNVAVCFVGDGLGDIAGTLASLSIPAGAAFATSGGYAHSNRIPQPASTPAPQATLDPLCAGIPDQKWTLTVSAAQNPNLDRKSISDVLLGLEYSAEATYS